jgi:hypothetical protein
MSRSVWAAVGAGVFALVLGPVAVCAASPLSLAAAPVGPHRTLVSTPARASQARSGRGRAFAACRAPRVASSVRWGRGLASTGR